MIHKLKWTRYIGLFVLGIIYLIVIPLIWGHSSFILNIAITASIFSIAALGVWICFKVGLMNMGQSIFLALGGYCTAILSVKLGLSFWLCLPISGILAAVVGLFLGSVTRWLKGFYFSILTFVLNMAMKQILMISDFTGGASGIRNVARPNSVSIGSLTIIPQFNGDNKLPYYFLAAVLLIITVIIIWRLTKCPIGRMTDALCQNDKLAASVGINIVKYRLISICTSSFLAGISGAFFVGYTTVIYPITYTTTESIYLPIYCLFGGVNYLIGPILGAFFFQAVFPFLSILHDYQAIIYALIMIVVIRWLPNGIISLRFRRKKVAE